MKMCVLVSLVAILISQVVVASQPVYLFSEDGGEHAPYYCKKKDKAPTKLVKKKNFKKESGYLGSLQTEFADKNEAGIDAWSHFFRTSKACEKSLKKINKLYSE